MTLYNKKDIATLLDKFMAGATTIEEEQTLADYFRSEQRVPAEWEDYKDMFAYFDNGMVEVSEQKEDNAKARPAAIVLWKRIAVAAILLILIGFAFYLSAVAFTTLIASVIYLLIAAIGTFATVYIYKRTFYKFNQEIGE